MNEFLVFFLIVSISTFNVFCMNSSIFGPPPPEGVEFDECLFVPKITGKALTNTFYNYRHICREKLPDNGPEQPQRERNWYFVGKLDNDFETTSLDLQKFHYLPFEQSLVQFVLLEGTIAEFALRSTDGKFQVTFQSLQQRNAFYRLIYHNVNLNKAAQNKIGAFHEIMQEPEFKKIGHNVEALCEKINDFWHVTFKSERGEPLLIFPGATAAIMRVKRLDPGKNVSQLLFRINMEHYILTFSNSADTKHFSDDLLNYVAILYMKYVPADVKTRFVNNRITINI